MAALTRKDFFKYEDDTKDRKQKILDFYKKGTPFELKDGTNVVFKFQQSVYDKIAGLRSGDAPIVYSSIVFTTTTGQQKKLTDLGKSENLGGGKGSGGGATNTKTQESSVCLWCAVNKKYGKSDQKTVVTNYKNVKSLYCVNEVDTAMINQKDPEWLNHYEQVSKFLVGSLFNIGEYEFHRGSGKVDTIYNVFKKLNKLLDVPFNDQNKWNPGDIWVFKKGFDLPGIEKCQTIDCLNSYVLNALIDRNMIAISLKLIESTTPRQKNFNVGEKRPPSIWNGYRVAATGKNIFGSKDVYIYAKGEDEINMQFRSFDNLSGWQGELIGTTAKYGKGAYGTVNRNLEDLKLETLPAQQDIIQKAKAKDIPTLIELYTMFKKHSAPGMTLTDFLAACKKPDIKPDWIYSKYLGVKMIDILMDTTTTQAKRNTFTQGMVGYALSNSKCSSAFIKIY